MLNIFAYKFQCVWPVQKLIKKYCVINKKIILKVRYVKANFSHMSFFMSIFWRKIVIVKQSDN